MKLPQWLMILPMVAVASVAAVVIAPTSTQATPLAGNTAAHAPLSAAELAKLPLTNRHLTPHEIVNLATVLGAYHDAEGASTNPAAFINSFTKDGVFTSVITNQSYRGAALGDVVTRTAAMFPDVHRDLRSISVNGDVISIQLHIQGTFEGPLQTPAGVLKPNGAKVDYPTDDFFYLSNGKIKEFDCLIGLSAEMSQLGVNFDWASAVAAG
jgi:predicted ester cyclase